MMTSPNGNIVLVTGPMSGEFTGGLPWQLFENYRPISLLTAISKIFERVVFNQLYDHLTKHNLLFEGQYGFRKRHSTEYAALELVDRILNSLDNRKLPISIFLDLSKAFDTLDYEILLYKLHHYGTRNSTLNWFRSYLTNRTQYIEIDGIKSNSRPLLIGVPQGSILGPLLFIIYMNDINKVSSKFDFILYADDTTMISSMCKFTFDRRAFIDANINRELSKISDWLIVTKLSLNISKTKFIQFHYKQKITNEDNYPKLKINDSEIERVQEFNFLGLTINENLDWSSHCNKIACKTSRTLGIMNILKHELPSAILKLMYDALIMSHFQYCITSWGYSCYRLFKLQKRAIRIVTLSKYNAHTDPLFKSNKLLKIEDIFEIQCLKLYYRYWKVILPKYLLDMFIENRDVHTHNTRSRQTSYLHHGVTRTVSARNCIRYSLPVLIDRTSNNVLQRVTRHSIDAFAFLAKSYALERYENDCHFRNCYICRRR